MTSPPPTASVSVLARFGLTRQQWGMATVAKLAPLLALLLLVIIGAIVSPSFFSPSNIRSLLLSSAILMIFAVGQTFVISTGGIDLSVASISQLSGITLGLLVVSGWSAGAAIPIALLVGALAGVLNGLIISKLKITDFIVTLGTFSAFSGLTLLLSNARPQVVNSTILIKVATGGIGPVSYLLIIALVIAAIAYLVMFHTPFGTHVLAIGGNRKAGEALGLSFSRIKIGVYGIAGLLAGVAGILLVARLGAAEPTAGTAYQLTSIAATVLGGVSLFGGKSSIVGPLLGAVVLTGVVNLLTIAGVPVYYQPIAVGAVVVLAAYLRRYER